MELESVEVKKVDSQGRLILPSDWRSDHLKETQEVYLIKRENYIKIIPKQKVDLEKFFDKADLDVSAIGDWSAFEKVHSEKALK